MRAELIYDEETRDWVYRQKLRCARIDYQDGCFFITIQVHHNKSVFGAIVGRECVLNELGLAIRDAWLNEHKHVPGLVIREFVVMPNHFHAIVDYTSPARSGAGTTFSEPSCFSSSPCATAHESNGGCPSSPCATVHRGWLPTHLAPQKYTRDPSARDLPYVVGVFKSWTTKLYHRLKAAGRCVDIGPHLWQSSFYDEVITNEKQYRNTARYITDNAANWNSDRFGLVTDYAEGELPLLQGAYVAYLSSEGYAANVAYGDLPMVPYRLSAGHGKMAYAGRLPIISTFTSYYERMVLEKCLASGRRFIWVCPGGSLEMILRGYGLHKACLTRSYGKF